MRKSRKNDSSVKDISLLTSYSESVYMRGRNYFGNEGEMVFYDELSIANDGALLF